MAWLSSYKLFTLLLLAGLLTSIPAGAETFIGMVVSTGEEHFIFREQPEENGNSAARELQVVFVPANKGPFPIDRAFPHCVRIGKTVRLKGHFDAGKDIFLAQEIRGWPGPGKHHHDPTGVRARLGRCRKPPGPP